MGIDPAAVAENQPLDIGMGGEQAMDNSADQLRQFDSLFQEFEPTLL